MLVIKYDKPYSKMDHESREHLRFAVQEEFRKHHGKKIETKNGKSLRQGVYETSCLKKISLLREEFNLSGITNVRYTSEQGCKVIERQEACPDSDYIEILVQPAKPDSARAKSGVIQAITVELGREFEACFPKAIQERIRRNQELDARANRIA